MTRTIFGSAFAAVLAVTATVAAQNPQTPSTQPEAPRAQPSATDTTTDQQARAVTVEGCLMREEDVPGRDPNVAERIGIGEDYILTSTRMVKGTAPGNSSSMSSRPGQSSSAGASSSQPSAGASSGASSSQPSAGASSGASSSQSSTSASSSQRPAQSTSSASMQPMYEIEGIDDDRLERFVGQRVQIDGVFENVDQATDAREAGSPNDDLVELRGTTIREVAGGTCPAK